MIRPPGSQSPGSDVDAIPPPDAPGGERVPLLEVRGLCKAFGGNVAVDDISFNVVEHQITGLIGPNGAGKTTVFNLLTGFVALDRGTVRFRGNPIGKKAAYQIVSMGMARTFQELRLFESLSALDNVVLAMQNQPGERVLPLFLRWRTSDEFESRCRARAQSLLEFVGLGHATDAAASDLSYGQQKRLALARVLASDAELIYLDEPAAGLDPEAVAGMAQLIKQLAAQGKTLFVVEHNLEIVRQICDKVLFMDQGRLVVEGSPETVLADPRVVRGFMGI